MSILDTVSAARIAQAKSQVEILPAVDWSDVETAREDAEATARAIGSDVDLLTALVANAWRDPYLRSKAEIHSLDDKIVLWDNPDKGHRIRLRLAHTAQYERVHNHRFSFGALILDGRYDHNLYTFDGEELDETAQVEKFRVATSRIEEAGAFICIDHDQLHTTLTPPHTVSLMVQSPAKKKRAFIIRREDGAVWWRLGEADETPERRTEVLMGNDRFLRWVGVLQGKGLIRE